MTEPQLAMIPSISHYMTRDPITTAPTATLRQAEELMRGASIRHLPVVANGELVGVLSHRDLDLVTGLGLGTKLVSDVMVKHPFIVSGDMPLDEVVEIMGEKKYGSAIVMGRAGVEGIFTAVDACRVLGTLLNERRE